MLVAAGVVATLLITSTGGGTVPRRAGRAESAPPTAKAASAQQPTRAPKPASAQSQRTSAGSLPQTHAYPSARSVQFKSLMASLWAGIVQGSLTPALAAFFPKGAYLQLKAIPSAGSDWTNRLVHDYGLDIGAAHRLLGRGAAQARLIAVEVQGGFGHWISPDACYNRVGYYEMPNARLVYRQYRQVRSFGIASMISWRGVWYVVHLGAILRSSDAGVVDEPSLGHGSAAYSGTC
jgi:hypothetical protein